MSKVIYKLEDDISTDIIYPGRYMATVLPTETPAFAFADLKDLNKMLTSGEGGESPVIVGGWNFGCGSSREQAASAMKGHEITVVAKSIARIFLQNGINLGLKMVICPEIEAEEGDDLEVTSSHVKNLTSGKEFPVEALPESKQVIIDAGGLIEYTRERIK